MKIIIIDEDLSRCAAVAEHLRSEFVEGEVWIAGEAEPGRYGAGTGSGISGELTDIYRGLVSNLPEMSIGVIDREHRFLLVDGLGLEGLGLKREKIVGRRIEEVGGLPLELRVLLAKHGDEALFGCSSRFEAMCNGRCIRVQAVPIDFAGQAACLLLIFEVTEQKRAEQQFDLAFQAAPCAMAISRAGDLTLLEVNRRWEDFFGCEGREMVGWRAFDQRFCAGEGEDERARQLAGGEWQFRFRTAAGEAREAKVAVVPLKWRGSECSLIVLFDLSELRAAERQLQELTGRLLCLQDEERRRIARELHDGLAQEIFALTVDLAHLEQRLTDCPPDLRSLLSESMTIGEQVLQQVRTLSYLLHPPLLEQAGLVSAVRCYLEGFTRRSGIEVEFEVDEEVGRLAPEVEISLFRIVQEGLANVARHSSSARSLIRLAREGRQVVLRIEDFGCGLLAGQPRAPESEVLGVGIPGMRQRMRQLGGRLEISSTTLGTVVAALVPIEARVAA